MNRQFGIKRAFELGIGLGKLLATECGTWSFDSFAYEIELLRTFCHAWNLPIATIGVTTKCDAKFNRAICRVYRPIPWLRPISQQLSRGGLAFSRTLVIL